MAIKKWKRTSSEVIDQNPYFTYRLDRFTIPGGKEGKWWWIEKRHCVNGVGVTKDGKVVLVDQYRPLFNRVSLEFVAGMVEEKEGPEAAMRREFTEESGFKAKEVRLVGTWATNSSMTNEVVHTYLVSGLTAGKKQHQDEEQTEVVLMTPAQVDRAIATGKIWQAQSIVAWHLARPHLMG